MTEKSIEGKKASSAKTQSPEHGVDQVIRRSSAAVRSTPMFRQSDLSRALRAAQTVGLPVSGFEIAPDGRIVIRTLENGAGERAINDWD